MSTLIIYDSVFGNTEKIAKAIESSLISSSMVRLCHINSITLDMLKGIDLLVVGSPTRGFRPTKPVSDFLNSIPAKSLMNIKVAAFDTRIDLKTIKFFAFRYIVNKGGYAAKQIAESLIKAGGILALPPEGFLVSSENGPLKPGELQRATTWLKGFL